MTLLIGTVDKKNIVLTADGLSQPNPITGAGIQCEDLQKIFPHNNYPIAIVHHGLNIINRKPVDQKVADFYKFIAKDLEVSTLLQIANKFKDYIDHDATETFNDPSNQGIIGFWIAGFGFRQKRPKLYEICWPNNATPKMFEMLIIGGDAQKFLKRYLNEPFRSGIHIHNQLYTAAEQGQKASGVTIFGGHKHQLIISSSGCIWTISPM